MAEWKRVILYAVIIIFVLFIGLYFLSNRAALVGGCAPMECHGPEVTCDVRALEMRCTEGFMPGDQCRRLASCETLGGECQLVEGDGYRDCVDCVSSCGDDFECARGCGD